MKLIEQSIRYWVTVVVGVILAVMFGLLAMLAIPKQLTPTIDRPQIVVRTNYFGASPETIEQEITNELEDVLKGVDGLREMTSSSSEGQSEITMEFEWGVDKDVARLDVSEKLRQVPDLPEDANEPEVIAGSSDESDAIAWIIVTSDRAPEQIKQFVDDAVKPRLERVEGVAQVRVFGGRDREMQVHLDPSRLAAHGITLEQVAGVLRSENRNVRAGSLEQDQQRLTVRTMGEYTSAEQILETFVARPVRVKDLVADADPADDAGDVRFGFAPPNIMVRQTYWRDGEPLSAPALAMPVYRRTGANVLEVMEGVRAAIDEMNEGMLPRENMALLLAYDQTIYINDAIALVRNNVFVGGVLAVLVLLLFLRSGSSTLVVSFAIPISLIGTFMVLRALDRTLNIISLAGLAFASGMVVDNAIVVLENIYRHRQMGKNRMQAAYDGAREVWGAVLASTLTTLAVFLPVIFIEQEVGQLFEDIAITISTTVALSLIVSITVIPMLSSKLLRGAGPQGHKGLHKQVDDLFGLVPLLDRHVHWFARMIRGLLDSWLARASLSIAIVFVTVVGMFVMMPKREYLPSGNQNLVFGVVVTPPGYGLEERGRMALRVEERLFHGANPTGHGIERMFIVNTPSIAFFGARAKDPDRVGEVVPTLTAALAPEPFGTFGFPQQRSIFQSGRGGRAVEIRVSAQRGTIEQLNDLAQEISARLNAPMTELVERSVRDPQARAAALEMAGRARVDPTLGGPELQVHPELALTSQLGLSVSQVGTRGTAAVDGWTVDEFNDRGKKIDLVLIARPGGGEEMGTQDVTGASLYAANRAVPLSAITESEITTGPTAIFHVEQARAFKIIQQVPEEVPLEAAVETVRTRVVEPLLAAKDFPSGYNITLGRSADDLTEAGSALAGSLALALIITYLLMCALFQSFFYPLVIMFSVPLAAVGGLAGIHIVNFFLQPHGNMPALLRGPLVQLDSLAMLGFIILIGIVVNNAILVVHQALNFMRDDGLQPQDAIAESVRTRIRPIFMTTTTSLFGMAPLVIAPGAGSELYRGMGAVILFGLLISTFFTLLLVPLVFSMGIELKAGIARLFGQEATVVTGAEEQLDTGGD